MFVISWDFWILSKYLFVLQKHSQGEEENIWTLGLHKRALSRILMSVKKIYVVWHQRKYVFYMYIQQQEDEEEYERDTRINKRATLNFNGMLSILSMLLFIEIF